MLTFHGNVILCVCSINKLSYTEMRTVNSAIKYITNYPTYLACLISISRQTSPFHQTIYKWYAPGKQNDFYQCKSNIKRIYLSDIATYNSNHYCLTTSQLIQKYTKLCQQKLVGGN